MNRTIRHGMASAPLVAAAVTLAIASIHQEVRAAESDGAEELTEIVVTGSRIVRRDYESQSPIVTVQAETFEDRASVGIEEALNQLPQFSVAGNAQTNSSASTPFPSPTAAPGAATVDLRNLGTNRSLVLVDGRRVQPVNGNLVVDLNTIPSAAIQSVEIISGGAAAVYGADAISGVVNLILKKNFEGAEFDAQYGLTQEGDGEQYQFSGLLGANYSDGRGNVLFGASYANRGTIKGKDRDWVRAGWLDSGTSAGGVPGGSNLSAINCAVAICGTTFTPTNSGSAFVIDQNGNVFDPNDPLNPAHPYTGPLSYDSGYKINPNGSLGYFDKEASNLALPLERWSVFGSTNFNLTENVTLFAETRFSETQTQSFGTHIGLFNIWDIDVPYNQAFDDPDSPTFGQGTNRHPVSADLADLLNARVLPGGANPLTSSWTYEGAVDWVPRYTTDTTSNVFQLIAGLRGRLPYKDWTWEVYGSHGKSSVNAHLPESFLNHRQVQQLMTADMYGQNWRNPEVVGVAGACTSGLPIFSADGSVNLTQSVSDDCANYVTLRMNNISSLRQEVFEANMQGTLLDIWAGPLQFAAGADYRSEDFRFIPDGAYNANQIYPNVVNNIALPVGVKGINDVREVYAEFAIPLVRDLPFVQSFSIDPGIRISDYKTAGTVETWKVLGDWRVTDWVRFRGGFQRANRAPNVTELFSPIGASSIDFFAPDPCTNIPGTVPEWGNLDTNPNRLNLQILCQHLMVRDGAPPTLYEPGTASADGYRFNVFGGTGPFPFNLAITGGNPDLKSEQADTVTIGTVLRSPFEAEALRRLTLSIDYYKIDIKGAIAVPGALQVYQQCTDYAYNTLLADAPGSHTGEELAAASPYCSLIQREYAPPQFIWGANRKFKAAYINMGGIRTSGVDVQVDWASSFAAMGMESVPGALNVNVQYSWLDSYAISPFPGGEFVENKSRGSNFRYKLFSTVSYANGPFSMGLRWQHLPGLKPALGAGESLQGVNGHDQVDMFGRWAINERYDLRFGIDNLLNADPEIVGATRNLVTPEESNNALGSSFSSHDTFGRRFFLGVKVSL